MQRFLSRWRTVLVAGLLATITLAAFWPVLDHQFIDYDDPVYVTENDHVQAGLTWDGLVWAFRTGEATNWHPLTWLSHELDAQLFGLKPAGHHLTSLLFHVANTLLLFFLLKWMTDRLWPSAFVAALFALHPLHVESVAWVAERKDVLSTFFGLLSIICYVRFAQIRGSFGKAKSEGRNPKSEIRMAGIWYIVALIFFVFGLMSKPMLVTLPFVLLLLDLWPLQRFGPAAVVRQIQGSKFKVQGSMFPRLFLEKVPFLCLAAASALITIRVQSGGGAVSSLAGLPLAARAANALASCLKYLGKTFWPAELAVFYPHPAVDHSQWPAWQLVAAGLALAAISVLAPLRLKLQPWFAVGWFWFLATLLPVIGLIQAGSQAMADRYTYVPLIGVFIIVAWELARIAGPPAAGAAASAKTKASSRDSTNASPLKTYAASAIGTMAVVACAVAARHQLGYWQNNTVLFEHALAVNERNAAAHTVLGTGFARAGNYGFALVHCRAATRADPGFAGAWHALGDVYDALGQPQRAVASYQTALRLNPALSHSWFRLGCVYAASGKFSEAVQSYQAALRIRPDFVAAHNNLATAWWSLDKRGEALKEFAEAVRLNPASPEKRFNFGLALAEDGKLGEAATQLGEAVHLKPDYAQALGALAGVHARAGNMADAVKWFGEFVRLYPNDAGARVKLGGALLMVGQTNQADAAFADARRLDPRLVKKTQEAGRSFVGQGQIDSALVCFTTVAWLEPDNVEAHRQLGLLLARSGKLEAAVPHLQEALRLAPGAESHYNLGLALAMSGKLKEAVAQYEAALKLQPDSPAALNDLAWILATAPQPELRNGPEAVRLAERAIQLSGSRNAPFLGTLAAAYAEAGRFPDAIKTAETARDLALAAGEKSVADGTEARLALYRAGQAYRQ